MKQFGIILLMSLAVMVAGCNSDDEGTADLPSFVKYSLEPGSNSNAAGTVTFTRLEEGGVEIMLDLDNTVPGGEHPAHLHYGEATEETTLMAAMLNPVDGDTGESITIIEKLMEGESFNFDDARAFNGHVKVHLDAGAGYTTTLAIGNVGLNAIPVDQD